VVAVTAEVTTATVSIEAVVIELPSTVFVGMELPVVQVPVLMLMLPRSVSIAATIRLEFWQYAALKLVMKAAVTEPPRVGTVKVRAHRATFT
jgi:hypothetical protein